MKHRIEFINRQSYFPIDGTLKIMLCSAICRTLAAFNCPPVVVSLTFMDNKKIKKLNQAQRSINKETDVLSFPLLDAKEGVLPPLSEEDTEYGYITLGDIVLSTQKALCQAEEYGHSAARELSFLTVHSTLHLLGFDHMEHEEQKKMRAMEEKILASMGLTRKD